MDTVLWKSYWYKLWFLPFLVPSGCVTPGEYVLQMSVMAAPWHTSQEDCESKPDRCFWSDGWDTRRRNMMTAICYYSKGRKIII